VLARLEADPSIEHVFVSRDGMRLLVTARPASGRGEAVRAGLLEAVTRVLAESELAPRPESIAAARVAWAERHRPGRWVGRADAWRLSWREAEQFADRFLAWLAAHQAPAAGGEARALVPGAPAPEPMPGAMSAPTTDRADVARLRPSWSSSSSARSSRRTSPGRPRPGGRETPTDRVASR
jgi:hypothetical protein